MRTEFWKLPLLVIAALLIFSCSSDESVDNVPRQNIPPTDYTFVHFNPASGNPAELPLPIDILRSPTTGRIAIPPTGIPSVDGLASQINTLSGFSTTGPIIIPFVKEVSAASVNNSTIRVIDLVDLARANAGQPVNPFREYYWTVKTSGGNSTVSGLPVKPLTPQHAHMVIVTDGVIGLPTNLPVESEATTILIKRPTSLIDANGHSTLSSLTDAQAQGLEALRRAFAPLWAAAEAVTGKTRAFIPFVFPFTTQPLFYSYPKMRDKAHATPVTVQPTLVVEGTAQVDGAFSQLGLSAIPHNAIAGLYMGNFDAPYYIGANPLGLNPNGTPNITEHPFDDTPNGPTIRSTNHIPYIAVTPAGTGPFPTMIFQHGITRSKEDMLAVANTAASQGIATIAIDLVLHGERTFGIDLASNTTGAPGPDGVADPSGSYFINLQNLLISRDNVRQSVSDLMRLTYMITSGAGNLNGTGEPELQIEGTTFMAISLGGIIGASFVATEPNISLANLNVPGARIAYLLQNSVSFGPRIDAGLAAAGIQKGTFLYDLFFLATQTIVDEADGMNYGPHLEPGTFTTGSPTKVLIQEMINDQVVPNSATRDLALSIGLPQVDAVQAVSGLPQVSSPHPGSGMYQYATGGHGSLIDPTAGPTASIQLQSFTFLLIGLSTGTPLIIDPSNPPSKTLDTGMLFRVNAESMNFFPHQP